MREELRAILREAYLRERKLNLLYSAAAELDPGAVENGGFFVQARENQAGDLKVLQGINSKYGNPEIDPSMLEKLGETVTSLRAGHKERSELLRQILEWETALVDLYKSSLRYLSTDDETRKQINNMLTVKLQHRRELMDQLQMF